MKNTLQVLLDQFAYTPQPWEIMLLPLLLAIICQLSFCEMWPKIAKGKPVPMTLLFTTLAGWFIGAGSILFLGTTIGTLSMWSILMHEMGAPTLITCTMITCFLACTIMQVRTFHNTLREV